MEKIRVGFVGLGGICRQRHVPGLRALDGVEIVAVANRTRESSERAAREFGIPEVCESWQELVVRDDVDAVFIGTWPYMHRTMSIAALQAGKHVFCQARMALDAADAKAMYDAVRASNRVAMLCPVPFGLSADATVARMLREGAVGKVRLVRVQSFQNTFAAASSPINWRKDHRLSGLNALTLGMYIEVVHRWLGWTRSVSARTQTFIAERIDADGVPTRVRIPDQFLFEAELASGAPVQYAISGCVQGGSDAIEIYGDAGALRYDERRDALQQWRDGGFEDVAIRDDEAYDVAHWRVERDFVDAIREGKAYHPNFEDGYRYMQVIQAVYDSAEQGRVIVLD